MSSVVVATPLVVNVDISEEDDLVLRRQYEAMQVFEKIQEHRYHKYIFTRIRMINGVKCSVELKHFGGEYMRYKIESKVVFDGNDFINLYESRMKRCPLTYETVHEIIGEMYTDLPLLKYNKQIERFELKPTFETAELVYMGLEICCVCHEETPTTTTCGHTLCIICWQTLKKNKCPICQSKGLMFCRGDGSLNDDSDEE